MLCRRATAVRSSAGAHNIVVASGLDWGYDLSGIARGYALTDPNGNGIVYGTHIYPWKATSPRNWDPRVGIIADQYPILVGEVGCEPDPKQEDPHQWAPKILAYIEARQLHWTAWTFHPDASPRMLLNWDYAPTPYWGEYVKRALSGGAE